MGCRSRSEPRTCAERLGYLGKGERDYKDGYAAGRNEGTKSTVIFHNDGIMQTDGLIDYLAKRDGKSPAWQDGFRNGAKESFKP